MKKTLSLVLALSMLLCFVACGGDGKEPKVDTETQIANYINENGASFITSFASSLESSYNWKVRGRIDCFYYEPEDKHHIKIDLTMLDFMNLDEAALGQLGDLVSQREDEIKTMLNPLIEGLPYYDVIAVYFYTIDMDEVEAFIIQRPNK